MLLATLRGVLPPWQTCFQQQQSLMPTYTVGWPVRRALEPSYTGQTIYFHLALGVPPMTMRLPIGTPRKHGSHCAARYTCGLTLRPSAALGGNTKSAQSSPHTGFLIIKKFRNYQYGLGTVLARFWHCALVPLIPQAQEFLS